MPLQFSPEKQKAFDELLPRYAKKQAALLPTLWLAQEDFGHLSPEALEYVAKVLELPASHVYATATFYTMYDLQKPGKYKIEVCRTLSCAMCGAFEILEHLEKKLGIGVGETSADGRYTLGTAECLGSCGTAPMFQINGKPYYENLTIEKVDEILAGLA
ncbi:MAG TPA: NAD(P)H-dependent oxidoreductase subunit E [Oscillatoriaceae cyanobacterium]